MSKPVYCFLLVWFIASCGQGNKPTCKKIAKEALSRARHMNILSDTNDINAALVQLELAGSCKNMDKANKEYLEEAWNDLQRQKKEKIADIAWDYSRDTLEGLLKEFFPESRNNDSTLIVSHNRDTEYGARGVVDMNMQMYISKGDPLRMFCRYRTPDYITWMKLYIDTNVIDYDNIVFIQDPATFQNLSNPSRLLYTSYSYGAFSATVSENSKFYFITDASTVKIEYGNDKTKKTITISQQEVIRLSHLVKLFNSLRMGKIPSHL